MSPSVAGSRRARAAPASGSSRGACWCSRRPPVSRPVRVTVAGPRHAGGSVTVPRQLPSERRTTASGSAVPPATRIVAPGVDRSGSADRKVTANGAPARGVDEDTCVVNASATTVRRSSLAAVGADNGHDDRVATRAEPTRRPGSVPSQRQVCIPAANCAVGPGAPDHGRRPRRGSAGSRGRGASVWNVIVAATRGRRRPGGRRRRGRAQRSPAVRSTWTQVLRATAWPNQSVPSSWKA